MKRILLVTPVSPFDARSGSEQRSSLILRSLQKVGQVDVLLLSEGDRDAKQEVKAVQGVKLLIRQFAPRGRILDRYKPKQDLTSELDVLLGHGLEFYDLIVGRYAWGISQLKIPSCCKTIVDLDDYKYRFDEFGLRDFKSLNQRIRKSLGHYLMRRELRRFNGAFVASAMDLHDVKRSTSLMVRELPNVAPSSVPCEPRSLERRNQILFVGSLWYRPNVEGVNWWLKRVWPKICCQLPAANLLLIGAAPPSVRKNWELNENVSAPGYVDDLSKAYAESSVVIVPIRSGGGTNIKVLEALCHRRPCVVTDFVARAFYPNLTNGVHFRSAASADDFASQVLDVLKSEDQAVDARMIEAGCAAINKHFTPEIFMSEVVNFARSVMAIKG